MRENGHRDRPKETPLAAPLWWSWDHSTNWVLNRAGKQTYGASNYYSKLPVPATLVPGSCFETDYDRAIRWAAQNGVQAIGVAGLLRDGHGGLESARGIARLGQELGVRVYGIAGILSYGGIYYDGDSKWSLEKFLVRNPECMAVDVNGQPMVRNFGENAPKLTRHACPSHPKVRSHVMRSVEWLFKAIPELGGLQFETGDTGTCQCGRCRRRREFPSESLSLDDMALYYPKVVETILSVQPEAWAICETYLHFLPNNLTVPAAFGSGMPSAAVAAFKRVPKAALFQWVGDLALGDHWPEGAPHPLRGYRHIMRAHFGTYWMNNSRHRLEIEPIRALCRLSAASGLYGISLFGEGAAYHANVEFNYLAGVYFSAHPRAGIGEFVRDAMAPRLGGNRRAADYRSWNAAAWKGSLGRDVFVGIADYAAHSDAAARRRWLWLGSYLGSIQWDRQSSRSSGQARREAAAG